METRYNVTIRQQSPAIAEYTVRDRPENPSAYRLAGEATLYVLKAILVLLNLGHLYLYKPKLSIYSIGFGVISLIIVLLRPYRKESLLVMQDFGVQTTSSGRWYLGNRVRFIPKSSILDILIHEAFIGFEIRFILVVMVLGENKLEVVFKDTLPRRDDLEEIWRSVRKCYYKE